MEQGAQQQWTKPIEHLKIATVKNIVKTEPGYREASSINVYSLERGASASGFSAKYKSHDNR